MKLEELNEEDRKMVIDILTGTKRLKLQTIDKSLSANVKNYLSQVYSTRNTLTIAECCVWLNRTVGSIYRYINTGKVVVYRMGGDTSNYTIDVAKTKSKLGIV